MLKTALVAMTVVGCDCDAKMCEFIRATPPEWSTVAECEEALKSRAVRDADSGYPTIVAICRSTQESPVRMASAPAIDASTTASTSSAVPAQEFATGETRSIMLRASDRYVLARNAVTGFAGGAVEFVGGVAGGTGDVVAGAATTTVEAMGGIATTTADAVSGAAVWVYRSAINLF